MTKMYRVHQSMRDKIRGIAAAVRTKIELHEEFDTMPWDEYEALCGVLARIEAVEGVAAYAEVDGRAMRMIKDATDKYAYLAA